MRSSRVNAALSLTELGFGGAQIGNLYRTTTDEEAGEAVAAAWDAGIRYFDTAPHYGLGLSEQRLGLALGHYPRDDFAVSTKVGRLLEPVGSTHNPDPEGFAVPAIHRRVRDYSHDGVLRSIEGSLARLGLDRIDLVLIHDPDEHARAAIEEAAPALSQLRSEGVIRGFGAGMNQSAMLTRFVCETDVDVVMVAGRYTLLDQSAAEDLLPAALDRGVRVINAGIFNSGVLSRPDPQPGARFDYAAVQADVIERTIQTGLGLRTVRGGPADRGGRVRGAPPGGRECGGRAADLDAGARPGGPVEPQRAGGRSGRSLADQGLLPAEGVW